MAVGSKPWQSRAEYLIDMAMDNALAATTDQLRVMRPVVAPMNPFPERTGFSVQTWTIQEVLNIDRRVPSYRSWTSGMPVMPSVLSDYSEQNWTGSSRNSMTEGSAR